MGRGGSPDRELAALVGGTRPLGQGIDVPANSCLTPNAPPVAARSAPCTSSRSRCSTPSRRSGGVCSSMAAARSTTSTRSSRPPSAGGTTTCTVRGRAHRYGVPDPDEDWGEPPQGRAAHPPRRHRHRGLVVPVHLRLRRRWDHRVTSRRCFPPARVPVVPSCVDGRRACPPEDCGGTWGYRELLEILADPPTPSTPSGAVDRPPVRSRGVRPGRVRGQPPHRPAQRVRRRALSWAPTERILPSRSRVEQRTLCGWGVRVGVVPRRTRRCRMTSHSPRRSSVLRK